MRTLLLPDHYNPNRPCKIRGDDYHYLVRVLRLGKGDTLPGTDRDGGRHLLRIADIGKDELTLETLDSGGTPKETGESNEVADKAGEPGGAHEETGEKTVGSGGPGGASRGEVGGPEIHLFQGLLKGKKMDMVVRQAVEAGVRRIVPVSSSYAVANYDEKKKATKRRRWEAMVKEAVQQSGSPVVTEVTEPLSLSEVPSLWQSELSANKNKNSGLGLFFHQSPLEHSSLHRYLSHYLERVALMVGPEGGFSPEEITLLENSGFVPIYLRTNVLRAETAAVYILGAVQTILTERAFWKLTKPDETNTDESESTS